MWLEKNSRKRKQLSEKPFLFKKDWHWRTHRRVCSFLSPLFPMHLAFDLVKMHWVFCVPNYFFSFTKFDKFYDTFLSPLCLTITKTRNKPHRTTDSHHSSRQMHQKWKEGQRSGHWWRGTLHVRTCSSRNHIIPLMRRPNTDSAPNMPVTLPRNQLLIRYVVTSSVHTVTIRRYGTRKRYKCVLTLRVMVLMFDCMRKSKSYGTDVWLYEEG
jgi:hypothetical protein